MNKNIFIFLFLVVLISSFTFAQFTKSTLSPAGYYTYGNYSNGNYSNEYSVFSSVYQNWDGRITAGYDNLIIHNNAWNYKQQTFLIGGLKTLYPFYLKLNYAFIKGDFKYFSYSYNYTDKTNLANIHMLYNIGRTYFGLSYTYLNLNGIKSLKSNQLDFTLDWIINRKFTLSFYPDYTALTDGRNLSSVEAIITYLPTKRLKITAGGFLGQRAYYFNTTFLTLLNQYDTQKSAYNLRTEFYFVQHAEVIAGYQSIHFENYKIEYWTAGLKFYFGI